MFRRGFILGLCATAGLVGCADSRDVTAPDAELVARVASMNAMDSEMAALGKLIFFDQNLSINNNQSCASCHDPEWGFTGPLSEVNAAGAVYEGSVPGMFGNRKPPSAAYATLSPILHFDKGLFVGGNFWDGRATGEKLGNPAADQAQGPFLAPPEQALATPADVVERVCASSYADMFEAVWGAEVCEAANVDAAYDAIALSIAAYEDSPEVNAFSSKYDAYLAGMAALTREERKGLSLFKGKGKCAKCHVLGKGHGKEPALFTDFTYDNLGVPANPENPVYSYDASFVDYGLGGFLATMPDYQAMASAFDGMQKVPTLRNVDRRPDAEGVKAFGHNGYFKSLIQIVHFYNTRDAKDRCDDALTAAEAIAADCWPAPEVAVNVNTAELGDLGLTEADEWALVAFLRTLSDGWEQD